MGGRRQRGRKPSTSWKYPNDNTQRRKTEDDASPSETTEERKGRTNRYEGTWEKLPHRVVYMIRHKIPKTRPKEVGWISDPK